MSELSDKQYILQVARAVVEELAPGELASFPLLTEAYIQNPESLITPRGSGEVELGMGGGELIAAWTPTILLVLHHVVLQSGTDAAEAGTKKLLQGTMGRLRRRGTSRKDKQQAALPGRGQELSREEMQALHAILYETAREHGVKDAKARQIADSVVGKWVIRPVSDGGQS